MNGPDLFMRHDAVFSPCRTWRYFLERRWGDAPPCGWVMLNPSVADETRGDATTTRCIRFAQSWGYGAHWALNLYAFVSPYPTELWRADDPVGQNDAALCHCARQVVAARGIVLAAWGAHGARNGRAAYVRQLLADVPMHVLGLTAHGQPRHPLYMPADSRAVPWEGL